MRQTYAQVPEVLRKIGDLEADDLPRFITESFAIFLPELGHLLAVRAWLKNFRDVSEFYLPNFEFKVKLKIKLKNFIIAPQR